MAKGAAWGAPAVAIAAAAPALAASSNPGGTVDPAAVAAQMLAQLNARRASIGVAPLALDTNTTVAQAWAQHLASTGSGLVHQNPLPTGYSGENLSATCSSAPPTGTAVEVGNALTNGWLSEPHSYTEWKALTDAGKQAEADAMYFGGTGYPKASGHRINLENPNFTAVNLGSALSSNGTACGAGFPYVYYGAADFVA